MSTQAIWINKTSKGFTVWAQSMPSYSIPNNQGLDAAINYFNSKKDEWGADNWDKGIGTFLGTIEGDRDRILCEIEQEKTADDLAWEEACKVDDEAWQNSQAKTVEQVIKARNRASAKKVENWDQYVANMTETLPTVSSTVKGRLPEYLKSLFILSSMTYRTEDNKAAY